MKDNVGSHTGKFAVRYKFNETVLITKEQKRYQILYITHHTEASVAYFFNIKIKMIH